MDLYDKLEDAVYYAAQQAAERGAVNSKEFMTAVYRNVDGSFGFLEPQGGDSDHKVKAKIRYPKSAALAALVHNHPMQQNFRSRDQIAHHFSPEDVEQAQQLKIPSYIVHGNDMSMSMFDPSIHKSRNREGNPFNHIPEVKPAGQRIEPRVEHLISALRGGAQ